MANTLVVSREGGRRFSFTLICREPVSAPADIARLSGQCELFLDEAGATLDEINVVLIALEELLTNFAKFGANEGAGDPSAEGVVTVEADEIRLFLADNGRPFDPSALPPPTLDVDVAERGIGGLGLYMLFQMFQRHIYEHRGGRNVNTWDLVRKDERAQARTQ